METNHNHYNEYLEDITQEMIDEREARVVVCKAIIAILLILIACLIAVVIFQKVQKNKMSDNYDALCEKYDDLCDDYEKATQSVSLEYLIGQTMLYPSDTITDEYIYEIAELAGAFYPDIIVKQSILESGRKHNSNIARDANNLFGMKKVHKRQNLQIGDCRGYGSYYCVEHSIICRVLWDMDAFGDYVPTREEYIKYLNGRYWQDSTYLNKINSLSVNY